MDNEAVLREQAHEATRTGTLPARRPDRTWTGPGVGFACAVCARPVRRYDREVQVQFEHTGRVTGLDTFHLHLRCFAVWELERGVAPRRGGAMPRAILIVDGSVSELFADVFAGHGWSVTRYSDGWRAGEALGGRVHYDAVLVGYRFEGIDGVDLITRIRALDHRKDVPIVMMTGTVDVTVVAAALAAGANGVVYKPVDMALLVATVSKCVEGGRRHQEDT
jgi:CheY-like chemotaxis protein